MQAGNYNANRTPHMQCWISSKRSPGPGTQNQPTRSSQKHCRSRQSAVSQVTKLSQPESGETKWSGCDHSVLYGAITSAFSSATFCVLISFRKAIHPTPPPHIRLRYRLINEWIRQRIPRCMRTNAMHPCVFIRFGKASLRATNLKAPMQNHSLQRTAMKREGATEREQGQYSMNIPLGLESSRAPCMYLGPLSSSENSLKNELFINTGLYGNL